MTEEFEEDQFDGFVSSQPKNKYDYFNEVETSLPQNTEIIQNSNPSQQLDSFQNYQQPQIWPNTQADLNGVQNQELNINNFAPQHEISRLPYYTNQNGFPQPTQLQQENFIQYPINNNVNLQAFANDNHTLPQAQTTQQAEHLQEEDEFEDGEIIDLPIQQTHIEEQKIQAIEPLTNQQKHQNNILDSQINQNQSTSQPQQQNKYKDLFDLDFGSQQQPQNEEKIEVIQKNQEKAEVLQKINDIKPEKQIQQISLYDAFPSNSNDVSPLSIHNNPPSQIDLSQQFASQKSVTQSIPEPPPSQQSFNLIEMYQQKQVETVQSPTLIQKASSNQQIIQVIKPVQSADLFDVHFDQEPLPQTQLPTVQLQQNLENTQQQAEINLLEVFSQPQNISTIQPNIEQFKQESSENIEQSSQQNFQSYSDVLNNFQIQNNEVTTVTDTNQTPHTNQQQDLDDEDFDEFVEGEQIEQQPNIQIQQQQEVLPIEIKEQQLVKQNLLPAFDEEKVNNSKVTNNLNFADLYNVQLVQQEPVYKGPQKSVDILKRNWRKKIEDIVGFDAECLDLYIEELDQLKLNIYKAQVVEYAQLSRDIQALRKKKQIHVDKEEYEEATVIRDTLRAKEPIALQLKKKILEIAKIMDLMEQQTLDYHIQRYVYEKEQQVPENPTLELLLPKVSNDEEFPNKLKKELKKSESVLSIIKLQGQLEKVRYEKKYQNFILGLRKIIGMSQRFSQLNEIVQAVNDRLSDLKLEREVVKMDYEYLFENTFIPFLMGQKEQNNFCNFCFLPKPHLIEYKGKFYDVCCLNFYFNIN